MDDLLEAIEEYLAGHERWRNCRTADIVYWENQMKSARQRFEIALAKFVDERKEK